MERYCNISKVNDRNRRINYGDPKPFCVTKPLSFYKQQQQQKKGK